MAVYAKDALGFEIPGGATQKHRRLGDSAPALYHASGWDLKPYADPIVPCLSGHTLCSTE